MSFLDDLPDFDNLTPAKTEECTLHGVNINCDEPLVLIVRNATEIDAWNRVVRKISGRFVGSEPTRRESFDAFVRPFAEIVVAGWRNANNKDGTPSPYTAEKLVGLLKKISVKNLRVASSPIFWATDESNFRVTPPPDAEAVGKP